MTRYLDYGIGHTPLQPITLSIHGVKRDVHLKLEGFNPTCSMKDRTAFSLVQALEDQGKLDKGSTIIESTSGNLGVAMARLCQMKGYHFIAVIDPKTTVENLRKMRSFGAQVEIVQDKDAQGSYLLTRLAHIQQLLIDHPDYIWTDQYCNPANPLIHSISTGPEIYEQMQHCIDVLFVPVSTGGTLAGLGRFLREVSPLTHIVGVDAFGSVIFGTPPAPRRLTGIGSSRTSAFLHQDLYDECILIRDEEAFSFCRYLFTSTGISIGGSSGAVLAACVRYLARHTESEHIVCICADHGQNYYSSIFNDNWLLDQGIEVSQKHLGPVGEIYCKADIHSFNLEGNT